MLPGVPPEQTPDVADIDRALNVLGCYIAGVEAPRAETDIASVQKTVTGLLAPLRGMYATAMASTAEQQEATATERVAAGPPTREGQGAILLTPTEPPE